MKSPPIRILHISDLHFSEKFLDEPDMTMKVPGRYGHNIQILMALDNIIKTLEWDLLKMGLSNSNE